MEIFVLRLIESLIFPPGLMILMMLLGSLLIGRFFLTGKILVVGGFVLLLAASLPVVSSNLLVLLEQTPPANPAQLKQQAQAIVILGGGRYADAPEYRNRDTVSTTTLARLRYAAYLHRQTGLPILVTGGNPFGRTQPEAELMRRVLEHEFRVPVKWVESASGNTWENASFSKLQLERDGIERVALVTHAWHMPRSVLAFEEQDIEVIPAPTAYSTRARPLLFLFVPDADALEQTRKALHEILGRLWYAVRY